MKYTNILKFLQEYENNSIIILDDLNKKNG